MSMPTKRNGHYPHAAPRADRVTPPSLREGARSAARSAAEKAAELKRKAAARTERFLADQKSDAAERIGQVGAAIRQAADRLYEDHGEGGLGEYLESAADNVEQ